MTLLRLVPLSIALAACAASQPAVPVMGPAGEVHALAGQWSGEYSSAETGRSGSISFTLRAADDSAFGDVVMIPAGATRPIAPWQQQDVGAARPGSGAPAVLSIRFVRVAAGHVNGTLAPTPTR